jgi:hypothetical protein
MNPFETELEQMEAIGIICMFRLGHCDYVDVRSKLETDEIAWACQSLDNALEVNVEELEIND